MIIDAGCVDEINLTLQIGADDEQDGQAER